VNMARVTALTLPDADQIPSFACAFATERSSRYCVVIPILNEGERIIGQLLAMKNAHLGLDTVVVDGGSTDGSTSPHRLRDELGVGALLVKTGPGRLSAQLRIGMAWCLERGYAGIVTIDGNGKDDFRRIPDFAAKLDAGFDYIQGSRYAHGGVGENTPIDRELAVRFIHAPLISLGAGLRYTDTTNGFRGFSHRLLLDPRVRPFRKVFDTYNLHYYLSVRAPRLNFRVCEIPVSRRYPRSGPLPTKITHWNLKLHILKQTIVAACGGYNPR